MLSMYVGPVARTRHIWPSSIVPPKLAHDGGAAAAGQPNRATDVSATAAIR